MNADGKRIEQKDAKGNEEIRFGDDVEARAGQANVPTNRKEQNKPK